MQTTGVWFLTLIEKWNPYHDSRGRFTSRSFSGKATAAAMGNQDRARVVNSKNYFDKKTGKIVHEGRKGAPRYAEKQWDKADQAIRGGAMTGREFTKNYDEFEREIGKGITARDGVRYTAPPHAYAHVVGTRYKNKDAYTPTVADMKAVITNASKRATAVENKSGKTNYAYYKKVNGRDLIVLAGGGIIRTAYEASPHRMKSLFGDQGGASR